MTIQQQRNSSLFYFLSRTFHFKIDEIVHFLVSKQASSEWGIRSHDKVSYAHLLEKWTQLLFGRSNRVSTKWRLHVQLNFHSRFVSLPAFGNSRIILFRWEPENHSRDTTPPLATGHTQPSAPSESVVANFLFDGARCTEELLMASSPRPPCIRAFDAAR